MIFNRHAFLFADGFFAALEHTRLLYIMGGQGAGKTLLTMAVGLNLFQNRLVEHFCYNFPCSLPYSEPTDGKRTYYIFDEAGRFFDARFAFKEKERTELLMESMFSLRKRGSYLAFPSFLDVDAKIRRSSVRVWSTFKRKSVIWYNWEIGDNDKDSVQSGAFKGGMFFLLNPAAFYGSYDTWYIPSSVQLAEFAQKMVAHARE